MAIVLALSGPIASGKTTVAKALGRELNWPVVSFGDYIRSIASDRAIEPSRENLQEIGKELIQQGVPEFCEAVLRHSNWSHGTSIIVEGIRHVEVAESMRARVIPDVFKLVYLTTDTSVLNARLEARGSSADQIVAHQRHSTEVQVKDRLQAVADKSITTNVDLVASTKMVLEWLRDLDPN